MEECKFEASFDDLTLKEKKSIVNLKIKISACDFKKYCKEENIDNVNWKFKNGKSQESFKWKELYEFSYTQGLGIINIKLGFVVNKLIEELNSKHQIGL